MKRASKKISYFTFFFIFLFGISFLNAQEKVEDYPEGISADSLLTIARTIIDSAKCRTLITVDENGKPQARAMSPFPPEENMIIWLGTSVNSRKVKQIKSNPQVMVYYYYSDGLSYVSVAGTARLVDDPEKKSHYWKEGWTRFYPDPEKDYILIQVSPERMEICSFEYKMFWDKKGKPAYLVF
jgi:general stress protein 26